jgi:hypothetical protein|nr:MAG TPA: hypothetical protein [Caudoviricetes sp.]
MKFRTAAIVIVILQGCATVDKPQRVEYDPDMDFPFICGMYACPRHN